MGNKNKGTNSGVTDSIESARFAALLRRRRRNAGQIASHHAAARIQCSAASMVILCTTDHGNKVAVWLARKIPNNEFLNDNVGKCTSKFALVPSRAVPKTALCSSMTTMLFGNKDERLTAWKKHFERKSKGVSASIIVHQILPNNHAEYLLHNTELIKARWHGTESRWHLQIGYFT